jgi:hypothetical protein
VAIETVRDRTGRKEELRPAIPVEVTDRHTATSHGGVIETPVGMLQIDRDDEVDPRQIGRHGKKEGTRISPGSSRFGKNTPFDHGPGFLGPDHTR